MRNTKMSASTILILAAAVMFGCSGSDEAGPAYTIEGEAVQLDVEGEYGTTWLVETAAGDLNGDGREDRAAVLSQNTRGTGVFHHLNVFLNDGNDGWQFVGEEFLGDRIKFDFIEIYGEGSVSSVTGEPIHPDDHGQLVVAYATHTIDQSNIEEPELYLTRHWRVEHGSLVALEDD
ncbi:MAG: hypothetical protein IFK94_14480 [Acidobacteria bacterium]|uniref:VCBS repeat-containing protein n=1 Tax=Candidatus Polarisedimenticola svalbardensis TaxID=2886004 RepID=A0A8J6Y6S0_9BACT|nr:hypothetical protein [Candidatus Polarisedimenticola svalbardensis]